MCASWSPRRSGLGCWDFSTGAARNAFAELPDTTLACPGSGPFHLHGGHRLWAAPEDPRVTYRPDDDAVGVELLEDGVRLRTQPDAVSGTSRETTILVTGPERFAFDYRVVNQLGRAAAPGGLGHHDDGRRWDAPGCPSCASRSTRAGSRHSATSCSGRTPATRTLATSSLTAPSRCAPASSRRTASRRPSRSARACGVAGPRTGARACCWSSAPGTTRAASTRTWAPPVSSTRTPRFTELETLGPLGDAGAGRGGQPPRGLGGAFRGRDRGGAPRDGRRPRRGGEGTGVSPASGAPVVLGLDVSTTATKAILVAPDGSVVGVAASGYDFESPRPLWAEQDPALWWTAAQEAIATVLRETGTPADAIAAVGAAGQMHGLVLLDEHDDVVRPAILWNDQRTAAECDRDPRARRARALHRHHRQRAAHRLHGAQAALGAQPRAGGVGAGAPHAAAEGLRAPQAHRRARHRRAPTGPARCSSTSLRGPGRTRSSRRSASTARCCRARSRGRTSSVS